MDVGRLRGLKGKNEGGSSGNRSHQADLRYILKAEMVKFGDGVHMRSKDRIKGV